MLMIVETYGKMFNLMQMPLLPLSKLKQSNFFICIFTLAYHGLSTIMYKFSKLSYFLLISQIKYEENF